MELIGFIGSYDKKDLLLNIGKTLTNLDKNVLIVDATTFQRFKYIVPVVSNNSQTYVSEYQGIDVAMGFMNLNGIAQYLGHNPNYDYVIVDTDMIQTFSSFMLMSTQKNFFVTSFDQYELQRGLELFKYIQQPMEIYKVITSADINNHQEEYLEHLIDSTSIKWKNEKIVFADTIQDRKNTLENQLTKELSFKGYSSTYKDSLEFLVSCIAGESISQSEIRRLIRKI